jgi:hypothetical protein
VADAAALEPDEDPGKKPPARRPRRSAASEAAPPKEKEKEEREREREGEAEAPVSRDKKETLDDAPRARQRRPWWEELFGDDFIRATETDSARRKSGKSAASSRIARSGCRAAWSSTSAAARDSTRWSSRAAATVSSATTFRLFQLALAADVAQEADQRLNFLQGDMREMAFEEMFDGVYCWNTTVRVLRRRKELCGRPARVQSASSRRHVSLDVANRDFVVAQSPSQVWYEGEGCVCMDDMSVDFITSRLRVKRSVILDDGRTRECTYSIRLYSLHELGKLLHDVGFRVTEASGHPSMPWRVLRPIVAANRDPGAAAVTAQSSKQKGPAPSAGYQ